MVWRIWGFSHEVIDNFRVFSEESSVIYKLIIFNSTFINSIFCICEQFQLRSQEFSETYFLFKESFFNLRSLTFSSFPWLEFASPFCVSNFGKLSVQNFTQTGFFIFPFLEHLINNCEIQSTILNLLHSHSIGRYPKVLAFHIIRGVYHFIICFITSATKASILIELIFCSICFFLGLLVRENLIMIDWREGSKYFLENLVAVHENISALSFIDTFLEMFDELAKLSLVYSFWDCSLLITCSISKYLEYVGKITSLHFS